MRNRLSVKAKRLSILSLSIIALLYATLQYTIYRGWGVVEWIVRFGNFVFPKFNWDIQEAYKLQAKVLAHTFDVALAIFIIVVVFLIIELFKNQKDESPELKAIRELHIEMKGLRSDINRAMIVRCISKRTSHRR